MQIDARCLDFKPTVIVEFKVNRGESVACLIFNKK